MAPNDNQSSGQAGSGKLQLLDGKSIASFGGATTAVWITTNLIYFFLHRARINFDPALLAFLLAQLITFVFLYGGTKGGGRLRNILLGFINGCIITFSAMGLNFTSTSIGSTEAKEGAIIPFEKPWLFPKPYEQAILNQRTELQIIEKENKVLYLQVATLAVEDNVRVTVKPDQIAEEARVDPGIARLVNDKIQGSIVQVKEEKSGRIQQDIRQNAETRDQLESAIQQTDNHEERTRIQQEINEIDRSMEFQSEQLERVNQAGGDNPPPEEINRRIQQQESQIYEQYFQESKKDLRKQQVERPPGLP